MSHWDGDFAEGFIGDFLAGNGEHVGRAIGFIADHKFEAAGGFFGFMEQLGLGCAVLQESEDSTHVGEAPFHDDFVFPIKLLFAALRGGIEKDRAFLSIEVEADRSAVTALVRFVDGVVVGVGFNGLFR